MYWNCIEMSHCALHRWLNLRYIPHLQFGQWLTGTKDDIALAMLTDLLLSYDSKEEQAQENYWIHSQDSVTRLPLSNLNLTSQELNWQPLDGIGLLTESVVCCSISDVLSICHHESSQGVLQIKHDYVSQGTLYCRSVLLNVDIVDGDECTNIENKK